MITIMQKKLVKNGVYLEKVFYLSLNNLLMLLTSFTLNMSYLVFKVLAENYWLL
jgi:hypothetical protein